MNFEEKFQAPFQAELQFVYCKLTTSNFIAFSHTKTCFCIVRFLDNNFDLCGTLPEIGQDVQVCSFDGVLFK